MHLKNQNYGGQVLAIDQKVTFYLFSLSDELYIK